jgi:hypothetical protein
MGALRVGRRVDRSCPRHAVRLALPEGASVSGENGVAMDAPIPVV